jgi:hypothetical protein
MTPDENSTPNESAEFEPEAELEVEMPADDFVRYEAFEAQCRLWVKAITPILQLRPPAAPGNVRVQFAFDRLQIAACERLTRLLSSDLPPLEA